MNGRKAKELRKKVTWDPDFDNRVFAQEKNIKTHLVHPQSRRGQIKQAKKEAKK